MAKLVVISGPNRGTSYAVQEGENSIGRMTGNSIVLPSGKVSKRHCVLVASNGEFTLHDQGSANGTFVNGVLSQSKSIRVGDRISVGDTIFELADPPKVERKSVPQVMDQSGRKLSLVPPLGGSAQPNPIGALGNFQDSVSVSGPPADLKGKALWYFSNKFMPFFHGLNLKSEWRVLSILVFAAFVVLNLLVSVSPLVQQNEKNLLNEIGKRASYIARQVADRNTIAFATRAETKVELGISEKSEGVRLVLVTDLEGRVIAPSAKYNQYLTTGPEAGVAVLARKKFMEGRESGFVQLVQPGIVVAVEPIRIVSNQIGRNVTVAMVIASIDSTLATPDLGEMGMAYSETLVLTGLIGAVILLILYRLTLRPFEVLNEDLDKVLKGQMNQVTHEYKMEELNSLWEIINSTVQRIPKSGSSDALGSTQSQMSPEEFLPPLRSFGDLNLVGLIAFDRDRQLIYLNSAAEELLGVRADSALGQKIESIARDESVVAMLNDLHDRLGVGSSASDKMDFSGVEHQLTLSAFGSPAQVTLLMASKGGTS